MVAWFIAAFLLLMLIGIGGAPVIWLISMIVVLAWWIIRAVAMILAALAGGLLLLILKLIDPQTWKLVLARLQHRR